MAITHLKWVGLPKIMEGENNVGFPKLNKKVS